jgi:hypothetical protein
MAGVVSLALTSPLASNALAQELSWAGRIGGALDDERGYSIAVDERGNVYTAGWFHGTADADPGPEVYRLTSNGNADIYVSRLDAGGGLVWARHMGGPGYDIASSIAVDRDGNTYTTGYFHETADFDPDPNAVHNLTAARSTSSPFVAKLDGAGRFLWAKRLDGGGNSIAVDQRGNVYLTGATASLVGFNADISVIKLDTDGILVWARQMGGSYDESGQEVATDEDGNVHVTGGFSGTADFDPGPGTFFLSTAINVPDAFVLKLDTNGEFVWAGSMGGPSPDGGISIAVDGHGNVYTTGAFQNTADFDPGPGTFHLQAGGADIYVSKLDAGGRFVWAKGLGGSQEDFGASIAVRGGGVYTIGRFVARADFDPGPQTYELIGAFRDIFVSRLDAEGNFSWAVKMGGIDDDGGNAIAVDHQGHVHGTGYFTKTADFDPTAGVHTLTSAGAADAFVFKLSCQDSDHDEVCDDLDECPDSILTPTVIIGGCDTGVPNTASETGCNIRDFITACRNDATGHGNFVSCVAQLEIGRAGDIVPCAAR